MTRCMNGSRIIVAVVFLFSVCLAAFLILAMGKGADEAVPSPTNVSERTDVTIDDTVAEGPGIRVTLPKSGSAVTSPVKLTGDATGNWYFEGSFPVSVVDDKNTVLGNGTAVATGDWMTDDLVPFVAEVIFDTRGAKSGAIVFSKDNPSGLPEHAGNFSIPVTFGE
jgi:hypothetical protein